ncbi:uncharacterized protein LOC126668450 [Mercurialis annua]|uniref:uncharacterized protein LOC126668450 n=1 Tax=Mercurialis annua TaxID=3986 RepID=UPI0024AD0A97|nr:uncharacterized protein LOC126668450 [Mercurialis annua]
MHYSVICNFACHGLVMHYGEEKYVDKNFGDEFSLLDLLAICKQFVDVNSTGITLTDRHRKELRSDADVFAMIEEHKDVQVIHVYLDKDNAVKPFSYRIPEDNSNQGSQLHYLNNQTNNTQPIPKVINVKIFGELKTNEIVRIHGDVIEETERVSIVQLFTTISKNYDVDNGLAPISSPLVDKEFTVPLEAVGHFLVAKYTPMTENGKSGEPVYAISETFVKSSIPQEKKKVRGRNKNKKVAGLKSGEKLEILFYNNRGMGMNQAFWSRHLGKIIRDPNITPVRVQTWKEIKENDKKHMWTSVKECFYNPDIEAYYEQTLEHMCSLWTSWRSSLNVKYVKPCKTKVEAVKNVPEGMESADWEWLVDNKFLSDEFQDISSRNTINRSKAIIPHAHRCGSKPHREIIYEMGGKDGKPPDLATLYFETRNRGGKLVEPEVANKYDEIIKIMLSEPSIKEIELLEKCFGRQRHSHVFAYGGGMKRKKFHGSSKSAYVEELEARLRDKEEENCILKRRMESFESRLDKMENNHIHQSTSTPNNQAS